MAERRWTQRLSVGLDEQTLAALAEIAEATGQTVSSVARQLILEGIARR